MGYHEDYSMEIIKTDPGYLTILTGKTDMGKSTITVYDASECLKKGQNVTFFSYEYCQSIIYNKLISHFGMSWSTLFRLNVVDAMGMDVRSLCSYVRAKKAACDVVYIDYLDLLQQSSFPTPENDEEHLKEVRTIVNELSALALELNISIVLLSQTGASTDFEKTVSQLNAFAETAPGKNVTKMFIGKGNIIDPRINYDDIVHIILVDGYDLRHFSSLNIKEIYK